jgi:hypothetical protein
MAKRTRTLTLFPWEGGVGILLSLLLSGCSSTVIVKECVHQGSQIFKCKKL